MRQGWRVWAARVAAPAAFLAAATAGVLIVRGAADADNGRGTTVQRVAPAPPPPTVAPRFYVVRRGDTLATIAEQNGTTVEALLELNPGIDPVALPVGDRIRVA